MAKHGAAEFNGPVEINDLAASKVMETNASKQVVATRAISNAATGGASDVMDRTGLLATALDKATYDPTTVAGDSFAMDNMVEGTAKILTTAERTKITNSTKVEIQVACSDEVTDLVADTSVVTFRMPFAMALSGIRISATTAPTGATIIVDVNESGATILTTKVSIDAAEKTSTTASSPAVISDADLADDAEITVDIDQIGSTIAGQGLKLTLIGTRA